MPDGAAAAITAERSQMSDDPWRLDGRVVMVSGSNGGIGRCVVEAVAASGARLSVCDVRAPSDPQDGVLVSTGDLAQPDTATRWLDRTLETWGQVDGLVNVAGIWRSKPFTELSMDDYHEVLGANLTSTWNACHAVLPHMLGRRSGSVVTFASTAGQYGSVRPAAHYAAAKGAIIALTKTLAREVSPFGVRINAISPGPIDTSGAGSGVDFDDSEVRKRTLLGRVGQPREVALAVLYLLSDASTFCTGTVLNVNGGSLL